MLIATGSCCCGTLAYLVYVCSFSTTNVFTIDPVTGVRTTFSTGVISNGRGVICDPTTGRVFVASNSGTTVTVFCFEANGSLAWSTSLGAVGLAYDIAVSKLGYVYVCTFFSTGTSGIYRLLASNGSTVTGGSWPYLPGLTNFFCICVDQSDNVYVGCDNTLKTIRAISLDTNATVRWTSNVSTVSIIAEGASGGTYGIAVNAAGTQICCVRTIDASKSFPCMYHLNSSTGIITGSKIVANSGGANQNGNCAAYDTLGNSYVSVQPGTSGINLYQNLANFANEIFIANSVTTSHDDEIILVSNEIPTAGGPIDYIQVVSGLHLDTGDNDTAHVDTTLGRIGAFGV